MIEKKININKRNYKFKIVPELFEKIQEYGFICGLGWVGSGRKLIPLEHNTAYFYIDKKKFSIGHTDRIFINDKSTEISAKKFLRYLKKKCLKKIKFLNLHEGCYKIRVTTEQSEEIQKLLFSKNLYWYAAPYCSYPFYTDSPFLYIENNSIKYGDSEEFFEKFKNIEIGADALIKYLKKKDKNV